MAHGPPARRKSSTVNGHVNSLQDDDDNDNTPVPPDGGWGWMVAVASFLIHLITDGITYSFGIFFNELIIEFNESNAITASVASILVGMTLCSGPISSSFVNRYGCRAVTIAGAILSALCFFISIFATNILYLIITIGIGSGIGFGLIYLPAIVSVTTYFEKYRSLATGIAVCGSGLGTFVFAPLIEYLVQIYGWRGAMLILSAVILNCIIFGAMFRPLKSKRKIKINRNNNRRNVGNSTTSAAETIITVTEHSNSSELEPLKCNDRINNDERNNTNEIENSDTDEINENYKYSNGNGSQLSRSHSISHDFRDLISKNHNSENKKKLTLENGKKIISPMDQKSDIIRATVSQTQINNIDCGKTLKSSKSISDSGTMYRPDILYQGSLINIPEYKSRSDLCKISKDLNRYGSLGNKLHRDQDNKNNACGCVPCSKETRDTFSEMMNFSLFKDIIFIVFVISNFCTSIGFNVPYIYIKVQAEAIGMPKETGSYLLSIIGIANTVARIVLGYISDKPWVNRLLVYNICLTTCGIATALSVYCNDFASFAFYASVFGFTIGAYVGLTSVILVDLLGLDKLTNAFGLLLLFQGIASLAGPPFAGWLYDITKKYEPGFLLAGGTIAISGLVLFAIPPMQRYRAKKEAALAATSNHNTIEQQRVSSM